MKKNYKEEIVAELRKLFSVGDKYHPVTSSNGEWSSTIYTMNHDLSEATYHDDDKSYICVCNHGNMWINGFFAHNITRNGPNLLKQEITYDKLIPNMCYEFELDNNLYTYKHLINNSTTVNVFDNINLSFGFTTEDDLRNLLFMPPKTTFVNRFNGGHKTFDFKLNNNKFYSII
jgi:hypothetical protein